jgi:hypothetical protein
MLRRVALVRTDVTEGHSASTTGVTRIGELGTMLAATDARCERSFLQEPHGVTSHKTAFLIVTAVKTSNLTESTSRTPLKDGFSTQYVILRSKPMQLLSEFRNCCTASDMQTCH